MVITGYYRTLFLLKLHSLVLSLWFISQLVAMSSTVFLKEDFLQPKTMKEQLNKQQSPQLSHCVKASPRGSRFQTFEWFFNGFLKIHYKTTSLALLYKTVL